MLINKKEAIMDDKCLTVSRYIIPPSKSFFIAVFMMIMIIFSIACAFADVVIDDKLINCIIMAESSGNPLAYNEASGATGLLQITEIVLREYNQVNMLVPGMTQEFMFDEYWNRHVGVWYLKRIKNHYLPYYEIPVTLENILRAYNWGIGNLVNWDRGDFPQPLETWNYIKKIERCLR